MAYEYDIDILAALWTGAEDGEEPYATIISENPEIFSGAAGNRILSTLEALRSHVETFEGEPQPARLLHQVVSVMLEHAGSSGFAYGGNDQGQQNAVVTGNVAYPVFQVGDEIDFGSIDGVTITGAGFGTVACTGTDLDSLISDINLALGASGFEASRTVEGFLRVVQRPVAPAPYAAGFAITRGVAANDNVVAKAGIQISSESRASGDDGNIYLSVPVQIANLARDRALDVFLKRKTSGLN